MREPALRHRSHALPRGGREALTPPGCRSGCPGSSRPQARSADPPAASPSTQPVVRARNGRPDRGPRERRRRCPCRVWAGRRCSQSPPTGHRHEPRTTWTRRRSGRAWGPGGCSSDRPDRRTSRRSAWTDRPAVRIPALASVRSGRWRISRKEKTPAGVPPSPSNFGCRMPLRPTAQGYRRPWQVSTPKVAPALARTFQSPSASLASAGVAAPAASAPACRCDRASPCHPHSPSPIPAYVFSIGRRRREPNLCGAANPQRRLGAWPGLSSPGLLACLLR